MSALRDATSDGIPEDSLDVADSSDGRLVAELEADFEALLEADLLLSGSGVNL